MSTHYRDWSLKFRKKLIYSGIANPFEIIGCGKRQVELVQSHYQFLLPDAYVAFLSTMGLGAGKFMMGTCMFFPRILELPSEVKEILDGNPDADALPEKALIIALHQGYLLIWAFIADNLADPDVFYYSDGEKTHVNKGESFTAFLENRLAESIKTLTRIKLITPPGIFLRAFYNILEISLFRKIISYANFILK